MVAIRLDVDWGSRSGRMYFAMPGVSWYDNEVKNSVPVIWSGWGKIIPYLPWHLGLCT